MMTRIFPISFRCGAALLALSVLLAGCGVKPAQVDSPAGGQERPYPAPYPHPATDPANAPQGGT